MIRTDICELLGIEYPIIQGGMAWVADAYLAAAVSNAGGLGLIAGMNSNAEQLREQIRKCRELTDKPFGVNLMMMSPCVQEQSKVLIEERVSVVTTGAGLPTKYMPAWIEAGIKVIPVVPSTAIAKRVARSGAVAVVAEGSEAGGHIGEISTMVLVPQVVDAVDIPVIAAGGIGDGRAVAAAFMLGAQGVQCGTCFLVANECTIHQNYKDKIISARDIDTVATGRRLGHPVRGLKNFFTSAFTKLEYDSAVSNEQLEEYGAGSLRKAAREGDVKEGSLMAGQISGLIREERPAAEIIQSMFAQAEQVLNGADKWIR